MFEGCSNSATAVTAMSALRCENTVPHVPRHGCGTPQFLSMANKRRVTGDSTGLAHWEQSLLSLWDWASPSRGRIETRPLSYLVTGDDTVVWVQCEVDRLK